jgi:hypothetical protein
VDKDKVENFGAARQFKGNNKMQHIKDVICMPRN